MRGALSRYATLTGGSTYRPDFVFVDLCFVEEIHVPLNRPESLYRRVLRTGAGLLVRGELRHGGSYANVSGRSDVRLSAIITCDSMVYAACQASRARGVNASPRPSSSVSMSAWPTIS